MSLAAAQATSDTFQSTVDVIYTVNGGVELCRRLDREPHVLLGYESHRSAPPNGERVDFVDWPFNRDFDPDFEDHLDVVKRERPKLAVAPDIENGRSLEDVLELADRMDPYVQDAVIVVPKEAHPGDVPDRYRVGLPLANWGSDDEQNTLEDYAQAGSVHFLGGTPKTQLDAARVVQPASIDSSTIGKAASFGNIWVRPKPTPQYEQGSHPCERSEYGEGPAIYIAKQRYSYLDRVITSLRNIVVAWSDRYGYQDAIEYREWPYNAEAGVSDLAWSMAGRAPPPCQEPDCYELVEGIESYYCPDHDREVAHGG